MTASLQALQPLVIRGGPGDDALTGTEARETLVGGGGADTLSGGRLDDVLIGGAGHDLFVAALPESDGGAQTDTVSDFRVGEDRIDLRLTGVSDLETAMALLSVAAGGALFETFRNGVTQRLFLQGVAREALDADDFVFAVYATPVRRVGAGGADMLAGGIGADTLLGLTGHDRLFGGAGNDWLDGGSGDDVLNGGAGGDRLTGGEGRDTLLGGAGNDRLDGGAQDDRLTGGAGRDVFVVAATRPMGGPQSDIVLDFTAGVDRIDITGTGISEWETLARILVAGNRGLRLDTVAEGVRQQTVIAGVSRLTPPDVIFALDVGQRILTGSAGQDDLFGGGSADTLRSGAGHDRLFGGSGGDRLDGGGGHDLLRGGAGSDVCLGGDGYDTIFGDAGDDTLIGGPLSDTLIGGAGRDRFVALDQRGLGGDQTDVVGDFAQGSDRIDLSRAGVAGWETAAELIETQGAAAVLTVRTGGVAEHVRLNGVAARDLSARDFIFSNALGPRVVAGGSGADDLFGGPAADRLDGREGYDRLFGDRGDDRLFGAGGEDRLMGGSGADRLVGGDGFDTLVGGPGADTLEGGGAADTLVGGPGADRFVFRGPGDATAMLPDRILDFEGPGARAGDLIDLSALDPDPVRVGDQAFGLGFGGSRPTVVVFEVGDVTRIEARHNPAQVGQVVILIHDGPTRSTAYGPDDFVL